VSGRLITAGIDEVGRGPLAGPVVAACVHIPDKTLAWMPLMTDSKKLTPSKRDLYAGYVREHCIWGIGEASVVEIDQINILQATFLAMHRSITDMRERYNIYPDYLMIDGNQLPKNLPCKAEAVVKGDRKIKEISCASIIAKTYRDAMMQKLAFEYPEYGWQTNMGYGTKTHLNALHAYGCTPHHRRSFAPVRGTVGSKRT